ncbi:predicted protein [Chaetoceros tenuissimus]|uniref:Uncharacterized protein n=1 Tax=Chaetoceros tenuissimus TaxID=426638 RepID=A0AAD3CLU0_9STRA|nr:predicted protein [Chaetoceros tenuissimus]
MSFIDGKYCLTCSCQTIERTRYNSKTNNGDYQISGEGLECSLCKCLICKDCISELSDQIDPKKNLSKYHSDTYPFLKGIIDYTDGKPLSNKYIGHCCIISRFYKHRAAPTALTTPSTKRKKNRSSVRLGGAFVLPEFDLILPTVECIPDVFSLGRDESHKEKWHFVLDEKFVEEHLNDAVPSTSLPPTWKVVRGLKFKLSQPHNIDGKPSRKPTKVNIFYVPQVNDCSYLESFRGHKDRFKSADISKMVYFDHNKHSNDCDVTIIIGINNDRKTGTLLLCRFHRLQAKLGIISERLLLEQLQSQLPFHNNGLERMRTGGSSGLCSYSPELKQMLHTHNSTPRMSKGSIFLLRADRLQWDIFYIGTKDKLSTVKHTWYSNPVSGGNFNMEEWMFREHAFLSEFCATKPLTAQLLKCIRTSTKTPDLNIAINAIEEELQNMYCARAVVKLFLDGKKMKPQAIRQQFYIFYAFMFLNFTLVMHAVALHLDRFSDGEESLENRLCFSFPLDRDGRSGLAKTGSCPYGRGGAGLDRFCFALLDWTSTERRRRRTWTHPDNQGIDGSATIVAQETGTINNRLNRERWNRFRDAAIAAGGATLARNVDRLEDLNYPPPRNNNNNN